MHLGLADAALFVRITELGTLSAAARERNAPVSQVTRGLVRLERACGVRLLHRSTHGLSLTDEGDTVLAYARRLLDTHAELQAELSGKISGPSGWVRVSVSPILAQTVLVPSLNALYHRHPQLHVEIAADDRVVDMAREGIDIAIRTGPPGSDTLVARQIGTLTRGLYASPAYVAAHGLPRDAEALKQHRLIANSASPVLNRWAFGQGRQAHELEVTGHTRTDNTAVVLSLVQHGVGIGRIVEFVAAPLVRTGALVPVLPGQLSGEAVPMYAVMLHERHRLPKIRACIEHWAHWMQGMVPAGKAAKAAEAKRAARRRG
jgi:DNA-binding transcriptional LysR family regulator